MGVIAPALGVGLGHLGTYVFVLVMAALMLADLVLPVWAIVDAASRSRVAFYVSGYNRTAWLVVLVCSFLLGFGAVPGLVYLLTARRKVAAAALEGH